jgi:hypothetical protein
MLAARLESLVFTEYTATILLFVGVETFGKAAGLAVKLTPVAFEKTHSRVFSGFASGFQDAFMRLLRADKQSSRKGAEPIGLGGRGSAFKTHPIAGETSLVPFSPPVGTEQELTRVHVRRGRVYDFQSKPVSKKECAFPSSSILNKRLDVRVIEVYCEFTLFTGHSRKNIRKAVGTADM